MPLKMHNIFLAHRAFNEIKVVSKDENITVPASNYVN